MRTCNGPSLLAGNRGVVDDSAELLCTHDGRGELATDEDAAEVGHEHFIPFGVIEIEEAGSRCEPSVVDQDVESPPAIECCIDQLRERVAPCHVELYAGCAFP